MAVNFRAIHLFQASRERLGHGPGDVPEAERIGASTVTLPLYPTITNDEQSAMIAAVEDTLEERRRG